MKTQNSTYYSYKDYCIKKYGKRIQKIPVSIATNCPNKDGKKGVGGCIYCINQAFNPFYSFKKDDILKQIDEGIKFFGKKYKGSLYFAYMQAYTSTYIDITTFKNCIDTILECEQISGIIISTRPDTIPDDILNYLTEIKSKIEIQFEIGVETSHDKTLELVNRCHTFVDSENAINKLSNLGFDVGIHLIIGLPGEDEEMILQTIKRINNLPISSVKFHHLQVLKKTKMKSLFESKPELFLNFTVESYTDFMIKIIGLLREDIAIERFISESPRDLIIFPKWGGIRTYQISEIIKKKLSHKS